jgi:ABC-2 type transport system ATP-binding protein
MVKVEGLRKRFGSILAVDGISFEVKKGEVLGLLGPNAAGKTTTMRIIATFLAQDEGRVEVAGYDTRENPLEVTKRLGYLPENAPLYLDMQTLSFLQFVADIREVGSAEVDDVVNICGLSSVLKRAIGELSRGFRQRVGLASVLLHNPEILILDEPTAGLDPIQISEIRSLIKDIGTEKTIILSTHILSEAQSVASRVLIINRGKIVGSGTPEELADGMEEKQFYVTLKGEEIERKVAKLDGVKEIETISLQDREARFKITASSDISEEIFRFAVEEGLILKELAQKETSLEEIFFQLTK